MVKYKNGNYVKNGKNWLNIRMKIRQNLSCPIFLCLRQTAPLYTTDERKKS